MPTDDGLLVRRCLSADEAAYEELVERHVRLVGSVIWRGTSDPEVVDDLVQETFLRVFRALPHFDRRARLSTWIFTIAHRIAIDHRRKQGRAIEAAGSRSEVDAVAGRIDAVCAGGAHDPESSLASREMHALLRQELARLPEHYRLAIEYTALQELDYATVAAMLDVTVGGLKTLVFRGKQMLRARLSATLEGVRYAAGDSRDVR